MDSHRSFITCRTAHTLYCCHSCSAATPQKWIRSFMHGTTLTSWFALQSIIGMQLLPKICQSLDQKAPSLDNKLFSICSCASFFQQRVMHLVRRVYTLTWFSGADNPFLQQKKKGVRQWRCKLNHTTEQLQLRVGREG